MQFSVYPLKHSQLLITSGYKILKDDVFNKTFIYLFKECLKKYQI